MDVTRIKKEASRLKPLAQRVLKRYPFLARDVEHLATHSNVMFRVVTEKGQQLVLRVGSPHGNTRTNIDIEVAWLDAIHRDTNLDVVVPIPTVGGALVIDQMDAELGKERPCVLFSWVPGAPMGEGAGPFAYRLLGQMLASLQAHGRHWEPPNASELRRWDEIFYYDNDFDPVIIDNPLYGHLFGVKRRSQIARAIELAGKVIEDSWRDDEAQIVHGDLHEWNVHMASSRLYAFDFEDVMIAMPGQDIAISLYHSRVHDQRGDLREAFRRGYEQVLTWPIEDDSQLDGFQAARQVMLMNYAARALPMDEARDYLDRVFPWLERYVGRYG